MRGAAARIEFDQSLGSRAAADAGAPGYALALVAAFGAPVRVTDQVMTSPAVATRGQDLLGQFLGDIAYLDVFRTPRRESIRTGLLGHGITRSHRSACR